MIDINRLYGHPKSILLVGTYPPPLGGISVFIYRLAKLLEKNHYEVSVFNTALKSRFLGFRFLAFISAIIKGRCQIIHVQNFDLKKVFILISLKRFKKYQIYFTDHNPFQFDNRNKLSLWIFKLLLSKIDKLIVVNTHILEQYKTHQVRLPDDVLINNVFIPPPSEDKENIILSYPLVLNTFLKNHYPLVMANAYQFKIIDGIDLYGIDMCIEITKRLKVDFPGIGFIFCLANETANKEWFQGILRKLKETDLADNFYFLTGQKEIWPLYERVQLFIRPTYKDGYGVSIDEAIYFKCPAIASNACERNPQAIIFENRNIDDLYEKCSNTLNNTVIHG